MGFPPIASATGNRFTTPTPDDNSSAIWVVTVLSLAYALVTYFVRLVIKARKWNWDDLALGLGYVILALVQWVTIFKALLNGLGKNEVLVPDAEDRETIAKMIYTSRIFLYLATSLSKCSILLITRQLFTADATTVWKTSNICMSCIIAYGVVASIALSAGCDPDHIILPREEVHCNGDVLRLQLVTTFDILTELTVITLPIYFIWQLQMTFKRKFLVLIAFLSRLPNAILSIPYLLAYTRYIHSPDRGTNITPFLVWQQILLSYSLISATIPCLKGFLINFKTGGLGDVGVDDLAGRSRSQAESYQMDSLQGSAGKSVDRERAGKDAGKGDGDGEMRIRPDDVRYTVAACRDEDSGEEVSVASQAGSERMIIRRNVGWGVVRG